MGLLAELSAREPSPISYAFTLMLISILVIKPPSDSSTTPLLMGDARTGCMHPDAHTAARQPRSGGMITRD